MKIACQDCSMYQSSHCDDCLVTAMLHPPDAVVEIDDDLDDSLQALTGAGLIPVLRFRPRDATAPLPADGSTETVADAG